MSVPNSTESDLTGQTAVVTGAAGGIGIAICETLAREGATVVATDVEPAGLDAVEKTVEKHGQMCRTVNCDVTDPDAAQAVRGLVNDAFGSAEILVCAHGIIDRSPLSTISIEEWDRELAVNLGGTFLVTRAFYDNMIANGYGKIVHIGSLAGTVGGVDCGPHYAASKGGVHAFTKWLAKDGADHGVYANAIAPGPVRTAMTEGGDYSDDMVPLGRLGEPADIAEGVVFLASQQSNWITGLILNITGGILMN